MFLVLWAATCASIVYKKKKSAHAGCLAQKSSTEIGIYPLFPATICQQKNCLSLERQCEEPQMNDLTDTHCFLWGMEDTHAASLNIKRKQKENAFG